MMNHQEIIGYSVRLKTALLMHALSWPTRRLRITNPEAGRTFPQLADFSAQDDCQSEASCTNSEPKVALV